MQDPSMRTQILSEDSGFGDAPFARDYASHPYR